MARSCYSIGLLLSALIPTACWSPPPHVVLEVEDPQGLATAAVELRVEEDGGRQDAHDLRGESFPITLTVVGEEAGDAVLIVEALDDAGATLARGRTEVSFASDTTVTATVTLRLPCDAAEADGAACSLAEAGGVEGICLHGQCVESQCGDGWPNEAAGEACDDGQVGDDRACTSACLPARCGDGLVWAGGETCDDGGICGDGVTTCVAAADCAGVGGGECAAASGDGCRADCQKVEVCGDGEEDVGEACDDGNTNPNDACDACRTTEWRASLVLGLGQSGDPLATSLSAPRGLAMDREGRLYIADPSGHRVLRVDDVESAPIVTVLAGTGEPGFAGDGGSATSALLDNPSDVAVDGGGNVYVADSWNHRIRKVCVDGHGCVQGTIETIAGSGAAGAPAGAYSGDGGPATLAELSNPIAVAVDGTGNVYVADKFNDRVRRLCVDGLGCTPGFIETFAGNGTRGTLGDGGAATAAQIDTPSDVAIHPGHWLYVTDPAHYRVRRVSLGAPGFTPGWIYAHAGTGACCGGGNGGSAAAATFSSPVGLAVSPGGDVYITDSLTHVARMVCESGNGCTAGNIDAAAGTDDTPGFAGDGDVATAALLQGPSGIVVGTSGAVYIADTGNRRLRRVCGSGASCTPGVIDTVVGSGRLAAASDAGPATTVRLSSPAGLAVDGAGNIFVADSGHHLVRKLCADGVGCTRGEMTTVGGTGLPGYDGSVPTAIETPMFDPRGLTLDPAGDLLIADTNNHVVRELCLSGQGCTLGELETVAGTGAPTFTGDGPATSAALSGPRDVTTDAGGNIYIADTVNERVRKICVDGNGCTEGDLITVAGTGVGGYDGDGFPATDYGLWQPAGLAIDSGGNIYIADSWNQRIRKVCGDGIGCVEGEIETLVSGIRARGIELDGAGGLYVTEGGPLDDDYIYRVCLVGPGCTPGTYEVIAGVGGSGPAGDGGPATAAELDGPVGLVLGPSGNLLVADARNDRVRQLCVSGAGCTVGTITTVAGRVDPVGDGRFERASLSTPWGMAWLPGGETLLVADGTSGRLRRVELPTETLDTVVGYPWVVALPDFSSPDARHSRMLGDPFGIAVDDTGAAPIVYVTERSGHTIRRLTLDDVGDSTTWGVETWAGALDTPGFVEDAGALARLAAPAGVALDTAAGRLYFTDSLNHVVRSLDLTTGEVATVAGTPRQRGFYGTVDADGDGVEDGVPAGEALFFEPTGLALGPTSSLYIADTNNHRVRRLDLATDLVFTVLGDGTAGSSGDGAPARYFLVDSPIGLVVDGYGNLFASSRNAVRMVLAGDDALATGEDEVRTIYGEPPRESFPQAVTHCISGLILDPMDQSVVYVLDACQGFLLKLERLSGGSDDR